MKVQSVYTYLSGILFSLFFALLFGAVAEDAVAQQQISPQGLQQIQALMGEKAARTPIQRKISSHLLHALKMQRREPIARGIPTLRSSVNVAGDGSTLVDIKADVTEALLDHIVVLGGTIINSFPQYRAIRAQIPLLQIEAIASFPEVQSIRPADQAVTNTRGRVGTLSLSLHRRLTSLPGLRLGFVTPSIGVQTQTRDPLLKFAQAWTGSLFDTPITNKINTSQGDIAHRAALARSTFGVNGAGIRIGVMSDSVDALASLQASGDLPAVTVLPGQSGVPGSSEGTAMLEIVHDLAPGAGLFFATAFNGQASFAANIIALRNAGCDIIVDDVSYLTTPVFQDGIVAQAVNTVTAGGVLFFSSAGNSGNKNDGTSGVWEGNFVAGGFVSGLGTVHNFGGGNVGNTVTQDSPSLFTLHWSDPAQASSNDYDLYLLNATLTAVVAASNDFQDGDDAPFESIDSRSFNHTNLRLVIVKFSGADRYLHLNTNRGRLQINTAGQTSGHSAAVNAFSVAAVNVATAGGGFFVGGATNPVETFSSDGPRRIFYNANGSPITPGNFLMLPDFVVDGETALKTKDFSVTTNFVVGECVIDFSRT
jgi:hypothetical protein